MQDFIARLIEESKRFLNERAQIAEWDFRKKRFSADSLD